MKPPPIVETPDFVAVDITSKEALPFLNNIINDPAARANAIAQFGSAVGLLAAAPVEFLEQLLAAEEANWKENAEAEAKAVKYLASAGINVNMMKALKERRSDAIKMFKAFLSIRPALDEAIKAQGVAIPKPTDNESS